MEKLTAKQEGFCLAYIETGNASEAYRKAYNAENMKPETIHRKASELMNDGKITARLDALQQIQQERLNITVDDLLSELEQARTMAESSGNANAMINATMGKAKLLGFDKQKVEVESKNGSEDFARWLKEIEQDKQKQIQAKQTQQQDDFSQWLLTSETIYKNKEIR